MKSFYQNIAIAFLVLSLSSPAFSQSQKVSSKEPIGSKRKLEVKSDFQMGGFGFKEAQDESQLVQFSVRPKAKYQITDQFGVKADTQLNLTTGRSQTRFQNPNFNFFLIDVGTVGTPQIVHMELFPTTDNRRMTPGNERIF